MDVSHGNSAGGGPEDPRRGLPVYATLKATISIDELNKGPTRNKSCESKGLGIRGEGDATLQRCTAAVDMWGGKRDGFTYGGLAGLACTYAYKKKDGSDAELTLYIEYLHLITEKYLPKYGGGTKKDGKVMTAEEWSGKPVGLGERMKKGEVIEAADLTGNNPPLVGYLGATQWPHLHMQVSLPGFGRFPRVDPRIVIK
jgi:hypothetical protein